MSVAWIIIPTLMTLASFVVVLWISRPSTREGGRYAVLEALAYLFLMTLAGVVSLASWAVTGLVYLLVHWR